jgi:hypothetical protein
MKNSRTRNAFHSVWVLVMESGVLYQLVCNAVSSLSDKWVMFKISAKTPSLDWHWEPGRTIWGPSCISWYVSPWIDGLDLFRNLHIDLSHAYFLKKSQFHSFHHASQAYGVAYNTKHCFDECIQYLWNVIYPIRAKCKKIRPSQLLLYWIV